MTGKKKINRRQQPPLVVLQLRDSREVFLQHALELATRFGWRLLDLRLTDDLIPTDPAPTGAIVSYPSPNPVTDHLLEMGCPTVRLGYLPHPDDDSLPAVITDMRGLGRLGADHFAERGFRDIGYVGNAPLRDAKPLYEAFHTRAIELECNCHLLKTSIAISGKARFGEKAPQIRKWLARMPKPIGIMTYSDSMAARISYICQTIGLAVPEDVAVLGCGNVLLDCEFGTVPLSSVDTNIPSVARRAMHLLHRQINGEPPPVEAIVVPPKGVVVRHSTDVLAVNDPTIARAMRFVWDYLDVEISVDDVAEEVGISRRSLERGFRKQLGRGVNAELRRKRLERCRELLLDTDLSVNAIVPMVGLRSKPYLHRVFRSTFGITPGEFRKKHRSS